MKLPMTLILGICIGAAIVFALSARSVSNTWALLVFLVCPVAMIGMMWMMRDDRGRASGPYTNLKEEKHS